MILLQNAKCVKWVTIQVQLLKVIVLPVPNILSIVGNMKMKLQIVLHLEMLWKLIELNNVYQLFHLVIVQNSILVILLFVLNVMKKNFIWWVALNKQQVFVADIIVIQVQVKILLLNVLLMHLIQIVKNMNIMVQQVVIYVKLVMQVI